MVLMCISAVHQAIYIHQNKMLFSRCILKILSNLAAKCSTFSNFYLPVSRKCFLEVFATTKCHLFRLIITTIKTIIIFVLMTLLQTFLISNGLLKRGSQKWSSDQVLSWRSIHSNTRWGSCPLRPLLFLPLHILPNDLCATLCPTNMQFMTCPCYI